MFDTRARLFVSACLKNVAGAAFKSAAPGSDQQQIGTSFRAAPKVAALAAPSTLPSNQLTQPA